MPPFGPSEGSLCHPIRDRPPIARVSPHERLPIFTQLSDRSRRPSAGAQHLLGYGPHFFAHGVRHMLDEAAPAAIVSPKLSLFWSVA